MDGRTSFLAVLALLVPLSAVAAAAGPMLEKDTLPTSAGDLEITFVGHGSLFFTFGGKVIHVDPFGKLADYSTLPKADLVLITHAHGRPPRPRGPRRGPHAGDEGRRRARRAKGRSRERWS